MTRTNRTLLTVFSTLALVVLAACGGGSSEETLDANSAVPVATEVPVITIADLPGVSDACESILNFIGATGQILGGQIDAVTGRSIVNDFLAAVDDEIRADAGIMATAVTTLLDVIEQFGDFAAAVADPIGLEALAAIETPDYNGASERLSDYLASECPLG